MVTITKIFKFEAAHHLRCHKGLCKNVHGHSYKLEITIAGRIQQNGEVTGMIMDFGKLKSIVNEQVVDVLDHTDLNKTFVYPTAELMVYTMADWLVNKFNDYGCRPLRIRLWETDTSYAEWRSDESI